MRTFFKISLAFLCLILSQLVWGMEEKGDFSNVLCIPKISIPITNEKLALTHQEWKNKKRMSAFIDAISFMRSQLKNLTSGDDDLVLAYPKKYEKKNPGDQGFMDQPRPYPYTRRTPDALILVAYHHPQKRATLYRLFTPLGEVQIGSDCRFSKTFSDDFFEIMKGKWEVQEIDDLSVYNWRALCPALLCDSCYRGWYKNLENFNHPRLYLIKSVNGVDLSPQFHGNIVFNSLDDHYDAAELFKELTHGRNEF